MTPPVSDWRHTALRSAGDQLSLSRNASSLRLIVMQCTGQYVTQRWHARHLLSSGIGRSLKL